MTLHRQFESQQLAYRKFYGWPRRAAPALLAMMTNILRHILAQAE